MKLHQLRYIYEVTQNNLNISTTADALFTSQPGVSKAIMQLEEELGIQIFSRHGKQLTEVTPAGQKVVEMAGTILGKVADIKGVAQEYLDYRMGGLSIGTTHTQARYTLPPIVGDFMQRYPSVQLNIQQGTPLQIAEMASRGVTELAIATEAMESYDNLAVLPCYRWNWIVLAPGGHALNVGQALTLKALSDYPLITYVPGITGRSKLDAAFAKEELKPRIILSAVDADVIKTYVRLGLGVGLIAHMAYDPVADSDLVALDASHLFDYSVTKIGLRRDVFVRRFLYDFIQMFAPHLTPQLIDRVLASSDRDAILAMFAEVDLPEH